jgi:peptidyl-prolyl cis-trans isomerase D
MSGVFLGILLLGGLGLVLTGSGSYFQGNLASTTVAEAGDTSISISSFDRMARRQLSRQGLSPEQAYKAGILERLLDRQIARTLLYQHARNQGVRIADARLRQRIDSLLGPNTGADKSRQQALDRLLRAQGMSESTFIRMLRQDISNSLMRDILTKSTGMTPQPIATALAQWQAETRDLYAVKLPHSRIDDVQEPDEQELENYYRQIRDRFSIPERRNLTIALLKRERVAEQIDISDAKIRQYYEDNKSRYTDPEKRKITQAVFSDKEQAGMVARRATKHDITLEQATKDVTGSVDDYMGEQVFQRSGLNESITKPVFSAKIGETVGPVKSALGWHVINVKDSVDASTQPLNAVEADLRAKLKKERIGDELFKLSQELDERLIGGERLKSLAKNYNLELKDFDNVRRDGTMANGDKILPRLSDTDRQKILKKAFSLQETRFPSQVESYKNGYYTVRVNSIKEETHKSFETVRAWVREKWQSRQRRLKNLEKAKATLKKLENGELRLGAVARKNGQELLEFDTIMRNQPPEALPRNAVIRAFSMAEGEYGYVGDDHHVIFMKLSVINMPAAQDLDNKNLQQTHKQVTKQFGNELLSRYIDYLRSVYDVSINRDLLKRRYVNQDGS